MNEERQEQFREASMILYDSLQNGGEAANHLLC